MLSLVIVLCVIAIIIIKFKWRKYKACEMILFIGLMLFVVMWIAMIKAVYQCDTGYCQQQITVLTELNEQLENQLEELTNDPESLQFREEYLNDKINSNNDEISRCIRLEKRYPYYRWLIYFK